MSALGEPIGAGLCHGSCVFWPQRNAGVLLTGPSGAGKSDLALRLIDRGWLLVSDDQVELSDESKSAWGSAPEPLRGKIAVIGLGIISMPYLERCQLMLSVELEADPPRFPLDKSIRSICGIPLPLIRINGQSASAPLRVEQALRHFTHDT